MKQLALEEAVAKASPSHCVHFFPLMHEFQEQNLVQHKEDSEMDVFSMFQTAEEVSFPTRKGVSSTAFGCLPYSLHPIFLWLEVSGPWEWAVRPDRPRYNTKAHLEEKRRSLIVVQDLLNFHPK